MLEQLNGVRVQKPGAGFNDFDIRGPGGFDFTSYLNGLRISPKLTGPTTREAV